MGVHVVVAEADLLISEGLAQGLREEPRLFAEPWAGSPLAALDRCRELTLCVLLLNEALFEHLDAASVSGRVDFGRAVSVLAVGLAPDPEKTICYLRLGCMGYVSRKDSLATLRKAVYAVAGGEIWAPRATLSLLVRQLLVATERGPRLTVRELEILTLIGSGSTNDEISQRLFISLETVRWHVRRLFLKIGARDRATALEYARLHHSPRRLAGPFLSPVVPFPVHSARQAIGEGRSEAQAPDLTVGIAHRLD